MFPHTQILKRLRGASLSLADLQHEAQVSLPTLRKAVLELSESHWIRIVGQADAQGGRPPNVFGLDSSHFLVIGVHLQLPGMHLIATNLNGQVLHEYRIIHDAVPAPDDVLTSIVDYVLQVRDLFPERPVLGIGIAAPGFIDPDTDDILLIRRVEGWQGIPICTRLRTQLALPVYVGNDVDCMALTEFQRSGTSFDRNLMYVGFDEGVKASLFLNGGLYKGALGNVGLIDSRLLNVEADDILEDKHDVLSIHGINKVFDRRVAALPAAARDSYRSITSLEDPRQRFERILLSDADQCEVCQAVLRLMNQMLALAVANFILIIQPHVCVLGGMLSLLPATLFADLEAQIRGHLPPLISHKVLLQPAKVASADNAALGATDYFLERYLSSDDEFLVQPRGSLVETGGVPNK